MGGDLITPNAQAVAAALSRILASPVFVQARRQSRLLRYIIEESVAGRGGRLSQFSLAIDVFDRDAEFDPATDSAVRVEVGRLRSKLREYYEIYPNESVVFRLPKGRYVADIEVTSDKSRDTSLRSSAVKTDQPTLVVLPFENMSGDAGDEYFADGITDDLITDLSKLSGLRVIARNSAFTYKGLKTTAGQLCEELGATHVLEGSVRRAGDRLRINAQLVVCATGDHLWADRFDRKLADIFAVQDEVGRRIVTALSVALTATDRFQFFNRTTENLEAYDYVLRAARLEWSREAIAEANALLLRAVALDPDYGLAHARIASNRWYAVFCGWVGDSAIEQVIDYAARAEQLEPDNSDVQASFGFVNFWYGSMEIANAAGDKSITLDPTNVRALERRAICLVYRDNCDAAQECLTQAKTVNPHEPYYYPRGMLAFVRGDIREATELLSASAVRFPTFMPTRIFLAAAYALSNDPQRSRDQIDAIVNICPDMGYERIVSRWTNFASTVAKRLGDGLRDAWADHKLIS